MQARVKNTPNIIIHWNTQTEEILGEREVTAVRTRNALTDEVEEIAVQGFFVAIGHHPNSSSFSKYIATDKQGYILTVPGSTRTNLEGVFAAGDVQDKHFRQAITAAGTGAMAALEAERYLITRETPAPVTL